MRIKYVFLVALLSIVLIVPVVLHLGLINLSGLPLFSSSTETSSSTSSTPTVFVDPVFFIRDYVDLPVGSKFTLSVNISGVADLFSWQASVNWNSTLLSVSRIIPGDFLMRTGSVDKTSSYQLGFVINSTDNSIGNATMAESILGDGVPGISGNGRLVSIEFLVLQYGSCPIHINVTSTMSTTLLNSLGSTETFTKVDGYFRNKIPGDVNGDKTVNILDRGLVSAHWTGPPAGPLGYDIEADVGGDMDGVINILDRGTVSANWGRSVTLP